MAYLQELFETYIFGTKFNDIKSEPDDPVAVTGLELGASWLYSWVFEFTASSIITSGKFSFIIRYFPYASVSVCI